MVQHAKCDKIADVDKFFEKSGMPLDRVKIVHVSTKMSGFYMVFYDDGLPYPEKKTRGKAKEPAKDDASSKSTVTLDRQYAEFLEHMPKQKSSIEEVLND